MGNECFFNVKLPFYMLRNTGLKKVIGKLEGITFRVKATLQLLLYIVKLCAFLVDFSVLQYPLPGLNDKSIKCFCF